MSVSVPMFTVPEQHAVLDGISYETYERLLEDLGDRQIRLTYDRGRLEIMSPSQRHERIKHVLRRMIDALTEVLGIPIMGGASTTWRRRDLERGLESNECYWVQSEAKVRGRDDLDLRVDPPPDLAIEVDVWESSLDRMEIYGALGIPEVWRYKDGRITVHLRQGDGSYRVVDSSACFPQVPIEDLTTWLADSAKQDETSFIRAFRQWVAGMRQE